MADVNNYQPTFLEAKKGSFKEDTNFVSLNVGTDAYVTEREMNELQWLQIDRMANIVKHMTPSGILTIDNKSNLVKCHPVINNNKEHLNGFELAPFKSVMNGFIVKHEYYNHLQPNQKNLSITLANPPVGNYRQDFVFIEYWFQEIKQAEGVAKYGGYGNDKMDFNIIDERIVAETSRRIQLKWKISVYQDWNNECVYGFLNDDKQIIDKIHPLSDVNILANKYSFEITDDPNVYRAGEGIVNNQIIDSIDGYVYAMPLFLIQRLNNSGYHSTQNIYGAINYVDETSVSDRPDDKFANIIYDDQITDLRTLSTLSAEQYNKIYITLEEYYKQEVILKNKINQLNTYIDQLYHIAHLKKPCLYNKAIYGVDLYSTNISTGGAVFDDTLDEGRIIYRKRKIYVDEVLHGREYAVIPTFIDYDIWNKASVGDFYIEKKVKYINFYNTGAKDISMIMHVLFPTTNMVYMGTGAFNGMEGTSITLPFKLDSERYFVHICPLENTNGYTGSISVRMIDNDLTVFNSGINTNATGNVDYTRNNKFQWVIIDMQHENWKNVNYQCINLNSVEGHKIISPTMGDGYSLILGTPIINDINYLDAGDIYADISEENYLTIYNTGCKNMFLQAIILNEVSYKTYYDNIDSPMNIDVNEIVLSK